MFRSQIVKAIKDLKPGTFFRLKFKTEVPTTAAFKTKYPGYKIVKIATITTRTGISYRNIAILKGLISEDSKPSKSVYMPVIKDKTVKHINSGEEYLSIFPFKNAANSFIYELRNENNRTVSRSVSLQIFSDDEIGSWVLKSYKAAHKNGLSESIMKRISLNNIMAVG